LNADVPAGGLRHGCVERAFMLATPAFVPVFGLRGQAFCLPRADPYGFTTVPSIARSVP
jgi:hypothetical protein